MPWSRVKVSLLSYRHLAFSFNNTGPTSACGSNAADWLLLRKLPKISRPGTKYILYKALFSLPESMEIMRDIYTCTIYLIFLISGKNDCFLVFRL